MNSPRQHSLNSATLIPVPPSGLGDLNGDGYANISDLLRIRDISLSLGQPATAQERVEADMDGDGITSQNDFLYFRDVLLALRGLPFVVDSLGGEVTGNGGRTTFVIPAGDYVTRKHFCVQDYPSTEFEGDIGSRVTDWGPDTRFMAGSKLILLNPAPTDSLLPNNISLIEAVPPDAVVDSTGANVVFAVIPSTDGTGSVDVKSLGNLKPVYSTANALSRSLGGNTVIGMTLPRPLPPTVLSIERVSYNPVTDTEVPVPGNIEPGNFIAINGTEWRSKLSYHYDVLWISGADTIRTRPLTLTVVGPGLLAAVCPVPLLPSGPYTVAIFDRTVQMVSNSLAITVSSLALVTDGDPKQIVVCALDSLASSLSEEAMDSLTTQMFPDLQIQLLNGATKVEGAADSLRSIAESGLDPTALTKMARWFQNLGLCTVLSGSAAARLNSIDYTKCEKRCSFHRTHGILIHIFCHIGCFAGSELGCEPPLNFICDPICDMAVCDRLNEMIEHNEQDCKMECCFDEAVLDNQIRIGSGGRFEWKNVCLHFDCVKFAGLRSFQPDLPSPLSKKFPMVSKAAVAQQSALPVSVGSIVRVAGAPIPASVGYVDSDGVALIPFNVLAGTVHFSIFDPTTGYLDPDAGHTDVGSITGPGSLVRLDFDPDTSVLVHVLQVPGYETGEVGAGVTLHEYRFVLPTLLSNQPITFAAWARKPLRVWLQDPSGAFVYRDSVSTCVLISEQSAPPGVYRLSVGPGALGDTGPFAVGASVPPEAATPYLCGLLRGTLFAGLFDSYIADSPAFVVGGDSLIVEAGARLEFGAGGSLAVSGVVRGQAQGGNLLILAPDVSGAFATARPEQSAKRATSRVGTRR